MAKKKKIPQKNVSWKLLLVLLSIGIIFLSVFFLGYKKIINSNAKGATPSQIVEVNSWRFGTYGLPQPIAEGKYGYLNQLSRIKYNPVIEWNVYNLLTAEKLAQSKGMKVYSYLTTGWLWFENGAAGFPDVYQINCNDNRKGYTSEVSVLCTSYNFQIAGYQAAEREDDYVNFYRKFYSDNQLQTILKNVLSNNSRYESKEEWMYIAGSQQKGLVKDYIDKVSTVTIQDISPSSNFFNRRTQFFTLLLGKDPTMVIALNSVAVSDLPRVLKAPFNSEERGWGNVGSPGTELEFAL